MKNTETESDVLVLLGLFTTINILEITNMFDINMPISTWFEKMNNYLKRTGE